MDNRRCLKRKSSNGNKLENFVFLPNNSTEINSVSDINANPVYRDAIASNNAGCTSSNDEEYDKAIKYFNRAIDILEEMNTKSSALTLGVCYQNRATANAFKKNYVVAILDASKAIELNEHDSKSYYRRAKCYYDKKNFYRSLQDIMQACVLERFKNALYINTAVEIIAEIDKDPSTIQWKKAYEEMAAASLFCDYCLKQHLMFVKKCGVFDPISVPIPENQPLTGYIRAMAGIQQLNVEEIIVGCDEENASMGKYLVQSYILKAYMNSVVIHKPSKEGLRQDMHRMNHIISAAKVPVKIKHQAKFCRANLYNRKGNFLKAENDLMSLQDQYANTGLFHIIKSSALFQFTLKHECCFESLAKCCELLPEVFELQFQIDNSKTNNITDPSVATSFIIRSLEKLVKRFPSEIDPRILLISFYIDRDADKAMQMLTQARKYFPNRTDELISLYGLLKPKHLSCVNYSKRSIRAHRLDPHSFQKLLDFFGSTTFEYAEAIEMSTKALYNFLKKRDFKEMFERRQQLLKQIIHQNLWDKL